MRPLLWYVTGHGKVVASAAVGVAIFVQVHLGIQRNVGVFPVEEWTWKRVLVRHVVLTVLRGFQSVS